MMSIMNLNPTGRVNRRDRVSDIDDDQVLVRENFRVIGTKNKKLRKLPGSDRLNSASVGAAGIPWGVRYYTKLGYRNTFFFSNGFIYYIDDLGNTTQLNPPFSQTAIPCSEECRLSQNDILYFSEGVNTGMYSFDGNIGHQFVKENNVALNPVRMISFLDRLWAFEEDSEDLHYSVNQNYTNFTDTNDAGVITIGPKRGAKLMTMGVLNETLYIFKQDSIWVLWGRTPSDFEIHEVVSFRGCGARRSLSNVETGFIFFGNDFEFYSFSGTLASLKLLSYDMGFGGDLTKNLLPLVNKDRASQMVSTYHDKLYRCSYNEYGSANIYNDMEYCFDTINETDFLTRGNNVGCYIQYNVQPDQQQLLTGRSDIGYIMNQHRGLNFDNQATNPTMPVNLQTKFVNLKEPRNMRVRRYWMNNTVLAANQIPIDMFIDGRTADSDETTDNMNVLGEEKSSGFTMFKSISQTVTTSRQIPRFHQGKCQNFSLRVKQNLTDMDVEFSGFQAQVIVKPLKRSEKVGL